MYFQWNPHGRPAHFWGLLIFSRPLNFSRLAMCLHCLTRYHVYIIKAAYMLVTTASGGHTLQTCFSATASITLVAVSATPLLPASWSRNCMLASATTAKRLRDSGVLRCFFLDRSIFSLRVCLRRQGFGWSAHVHMHARLCLWIFLYLGCVLASSRKQDSTNCLNTLEFHVRSIPSAQPGHNFKSKSRAAPLKRDITAHKPLPPLPQHFVAEPPALHYSKLPAWYGSHDWRNTHPPSTWDRQLFCFLIHAVSLTQLSEPPIPCSC